jgi:hypothetical protein
VNDILAVIGEDDLRWFSREFGRETTLHEVPDAILECAVSVDITLRDYSRDRNAIITIALITFAYRLAGKTQRPRDGANDIMLMKVLAKNEKRRRAGEQISENEQQHAPLYELITGEVGERIRAMTFMGSPVS